MRTIIVIAAAALMASCGGEAPRPVEASKAKTVTGPTAAASLVEWPDTYEATGTVRARISAVISSKVMGYVQQVHVKVGDRVGEGQPLVTLDARDLEANVRRAEAGKAEAQSAVPELEHSIAASKANLDLVRTTFGRIQELASKNSVSKQEFDEASARLKAAQATYDAAASKRAQLESRIAQAEEERRAAVIMRDYAQIKAPFAGVVTEKNVDPGALAAPGAPLLTLEREGGYRLEVGVEESKLHAVRAGQSVGVALEGCQGEQRVAEIVPAVDAGSRSYTVKVELAGLKGCSARSGMFGRARFPMGSRKVLAVPASAVTERGQLQSVSVVENGVAHTRLITIGERRGDAVEVLSGLNEGEKVEVRP